MNEMNEKDSAGIELESKRQKAEERLQDNGFLFTLLRLKFDMEGLRDYLNSLMYDYGRFTFAQEVQNRLVAAGIMMTDEQALQMADDTKADWSDLVGIREFYGDKE